ncbi:PspA/IM30 family protein [Paenibacillus sp. N3.4]|uniref:PspA/IM30 family protein n=1 Tax=Paenibacillus sp. N3.4 TaxID=2603222 RepID=UPI0011C8E345|nr:hypothetical protein [Paenibacillus sp. N3.4]TXK75126.1 hypothetical protein FU659_27870 [Paenibacillus sp. N3.4]
MMSMLNRIGKMAEAAWNEAAVQLDKYEWTGRRSEAGQRDIAALEQRYEEALQRVITLRSHSVRAAEMAQLRGEQAELAMRAGEEELARLALQEKQREEAACENYRAQYASTQDEVLALAEELRVLRAGRAAEGRRDGFAGSPDQEQQPQDGLHGTHARDTWRELEVTGRELGREAMHGLREASRISCETLKEAGGNLQQEMRTLRGKLQKEWKQQRGNEDTDGRGKK